jgi:endo-1,3(4)-beta-glucanase
VNTLIRDVTNPSSADSAFIPFRNFDWYSGHSWSQGLFESGDGKDQESTSEEVNYHYGVMLWGQASGNQHVERLGKFMLAVATRSIQTYFLMDSNNVVHPPQFAANKVTGIFFENKAHYTTWFGANAEYIHGIQMLPMTPVTDSVRTQKFIREEWVIIGSLAERLTSAWKSVLYMNYAMIDPEAAYQVLRTTLLDDGLTRSWALFWASTRPGSGEAPGSPTSPPPAPTPGNPTPSPPSPTSAPPSPSPPNNPNCPVPGSGWNGGCSLDGTFNRFCPGNGGCYSEGNAGDCTGGACPPYQ